MAAVKRGVVGRIRLWVLVCRLVFLGSGNCFVTEEQNATKIERESGHVDYYHGNSIELQKNESLYFRTGFEPRAHALLAQALELYPQCNTSATYDAETEPRLAAAFKEIESVSSGSTELLVEGYGILFDLILANANTSDGLCNADYVELAHKVLELEQKSAAENNSSLEAGDKLQEMKDRFHPGVFKLFNETARFVLMAPGNLTDGYALYATEKPTSGNSAKLSIMRRFDPRLAAFYWNLKSSSEASGGSRNQFDLVSVSSNETKLRNDFAQGPLRLVPTSASLLDTESGVFEFRLQFFVQSIGLMYYRVVNVGQTWMSLRVPPHLHEVYLLDGFQNDYKQGSNFALTDMDGTIFEKRFIISEEVHSLYPPCRNETDFLDTYRLSDFLQVFNTATKSAARLREAYGALFDEIIGSPFLCGQDYVQLAYHVLQRCADGSATSDDAEQQAWNDFKGRFNPRVFDLFDVQKSLSLASANKPGYAIEFIKRGREDPVRFDKRQLAFAVQFMFEETVF